MFKVDALVQQRNINFRNLDISHKLNIYIYLVLADIKKTFELSTSYFFCQSFKKTWPW